MAAIIAAMHLPAHVPLVTVTRGGFPELVHVGSIAVVDRAGKLVAGVGDPQGVNFTRSSLKPFQAVPFLDDGGMDRYGFGSQELALMCASHSGEAVHVGVVRGMLERLDTDASALQCGRHAPYFYGATDQAPPANATWSTLHHNCSGKHCGFLACCRLHGEALGNYLDPDANVQQRFRKSLAAQVGSDALVRGTDGCSAPNYALPLAQLARMFARLACDDTAALAALRYAMTRHPDLVSGTGRTDLALMQAGRGDWVSKIGADGVQAIGIRSKGIGIAIRIADGNPRALHAATVEALQQLGLLDDAAGTPLARYARPALRNSRGLDVGRVEPVFALPRLHA